MKSLIATARARRRARAAARQAARDGVAVTADLARVAAMHAHPSSGVRHRTAA